MTKNATTIWPHETPYALTHLDLHLLSLTPYEVDLWQTKNTIDISVFSYKSIYVLWWSKQAASKTRKNIFVIVPMSNDLSPCRTCAVTYFCHIHKGDYWVAVVIKRGKCTCPSTGMFKHFYDEYFWRVKKSRVVKHFKIFSQVLVITSEYLLVRHSVCDKAAKAVVG